MENTVSETDALHQDDALHQGGACILNYIKLTMFELPLRQQI